MASRLIMPASGTGLAGVDAVPTGRQHCARCSSTGSVDRLRLLLQLQRTVPCLIQARPCELLRSPTMHGIAFQRHSTAVSSRALRRHTTRSNSSDIHASVICLSLSSSATSTACRAITPTPHNTTTQPRPQQRSTLTTSHTRALSHSITHTPTTHLPALSLPSTLHLTHSRHTPSLPTACHPASLLTRVSPSAFDLSLSTSRPSALPPP